MIVLITYTHSNEIVPLRQLSQVDDGVSVNFILVLHINNSIILS